MIARPTATPVASTGSPMDWPTAIPTSPDRTLPPIIDQGCASGLEGTANSSTDEAPIGATINGVRPACGNAWEEMNPVRPMPNSAPRPA